VDCGETCEGGGWGRSGESLGVGVNGGDYELIRSAQQRGGYGSLKFEKLRKNVRGI